MGSSLTPRVLLFVSLFNSVLGMSILFPIWAPLGRTLGLSVFEVGLLATAYSLMQFVASPYWGRRSERVGRRPVLLLGIVGFAVGFAGFAVGAEMLLRGLLGHTAGFVALLVARVVGGVLSAATFPTAQAYMADITERQHRTSGMALVGAAFGLGVVLGPAIGAGLAYFGLLTPIGVSCAVAGLNAAFVWWRLPEPVRRTEVTARLGSWLSLPQVWLPLALGFVITLAAVAMEQTVAFLFQDVLSLSAQSTARHVGVSLVVYGVLVVVAQGVLARGTRLSPGALLRVGVGSSLLGFVLLSTSSGYGWLTGALALQGFGHGLTSPAIATSVSLAVGDDRQGEVAGWNGASQALARTLGPLLGATLYGIDRRFPYQFSTVLLALALAALLIWQMRRAKARGSAGVTPR